MAEALLRHLFEEAGVPAEVRSAGTAAMSGGPAHPHSREVARSEGLDLADHESRPVTEELIRWADTVIGMQPSHVRYVRELDSTADVRLVTDLAPEVDYEGIVDPIGWDREVYEAVFDDLRRCLEPFVREHADGATAR